MIAKTESEFNNRIDSGYIDCSIAISEIEKPFVKNISVSIVCGIEVAHPFSSKAVK